MTLETAIPKRAAASYIMNVIHFTFPDFREMMASGRPSFYPAAP
jgi:hypothetical protein